MPAAKITHRVFVDFENVTDIELDLIAGRPMQVTLLIGKNQTKLDLDLVKQIHQRADQVELIEVGASGRNALDMTLAYYLGRALEQYPKDHFHVVSKDKDYDPLVSHLRGREITVSRHNTFAAIPGLPKSRRTRARKTTPVAPTSSTPKRGGDRRDKVIARLSNRSSRNRPTTRQTLLAHIKNNLGKESTDESVQAILDQLCAAGVLSFDAKGKVKYT